MARLQLVRLMSEWKKVLAWYCRHWNLGKSTVMNYPISLYLNLLADTHSDAFSCFDVVHKRTRTNRDHWGVQREIFDLQRLWTPSKWIWRILFCNIFYKRKRFVHFYRSLLECFYHLLKILKYFPFFLSQKHHQVTILSYNFAGHVYT